MLRLLYIECDNLYNILILKIPRLITAEQFIEMIRELTDSYFHCGDFLTSLLEASSSSLLVHKVSRVTADPNEGRVVAAGNP